MRAVVAVADHRHFSEAARTLHTSQPNLSRQIREIETQLGARLFDRHTRGVALTPFGREFVRHASSVLELHSSGLANLEGQLKMQRGHVNIAALPSITTSLLADTLRIFRAAHPSIDISIRDDVAASIIGHVREARVDFGIGLAARDDSELEFRNLMTDNLMLVVRSEHRLSAQKSCCWSDLDDEPVIIFSEGSSVRPLIEEAYAKNGMTLRPSIEASHLSSAEGLVLKGLGVAILPSTRTMTISDPSLRAIVIRRPRMSRQLVLMTRRGRSLSPAADALSKVLVELAGTRSGK